MKKYLLCDINKRCSNCGSSLQLIRKKATWYYQLKQTSVERQTNLYHCRVCQLDHCMKGDHVDDSGWERLELPIASTNTVNRNGFHRYSGSASSVKTYIDPKIKEEHQHQKKLELEKKLRQKQETPVVQVETPQAQVDLKKAKGIHKTDHDYRNCGNCDFYIKGICQTHVLRTFENEVCNRFKHFHKREVSGGSFSPR